MRPCDCGAWLRPGGAWCVHCGRRLLGPPVPLRREAGLPWTVVVVFVVFALAALAAVVELVLGVLVGGRTTSALQALESAADHAATAHALQLSLLLNGVTDIALIAFFAWASRAVWQRNPWVRPLIVVKAVIEANLAVAGHILVGTPVGPATLHVLLRLACDVALLVLLWIPHVSRRWFGDAGAAALADLWPSPPADSSTARPPTGVQAVPGPAAGSPPRVRPPYAGPRVPDPRREASEDPATVRLVIPHPVGPHATHDHRPPGPLDDGRRPDTASPHRARATPSGR